LVLCKTDRHVRPGQVRAPVVRGNGPLERPKVADPVRRDAAGRQGHDGAAGSGHTIFLEDGNIYYGKGFFGDTALYQICYHTFPRPTHEERDPAKLTKTTSAAKAIAG